MHVIENLLQNNQKASAINKQKKFTREVCSLRFPYFFRKCRRRVKLIEHKKAARKALQAYAAAKIQSFG